MLFVFHVDNGTMMTFEMSFALESVNRLKEVIEQACRIPADKQVLLISGGESLDPNKRVCSYSAGTDTNPIYLFSKHVIENTTPPTSTIDLGFKFDIKESIKEALELPANYTTVSKRAQLAQQLFKLATEQTSLCEKLVHDQHLQQQGWSAVVANLEDITVEFIKRSDIIDKNIKDYMAERESYMQFLKHFNDDLMMLQKIPVLPVLLELDVQPCSTDVAVSTKIEETSSSNVVSDVKTKSNISLFEWISSTDNQSSMDQLFEHCLKGLEQFDDRIFDNLRKEVQDTLRSADSPQMKEVKGLGDRLFGLEQLMREAKKNVQEQSDLAQSFQANQNRATNLNDPSILPDLCSSHRKQLIVMSQNHQQLCDIRRRCMKAKVELSVNLYHRLKWVMYVENQILEVDQKLVIYNENLRRLRKHLEILQQIHLAPATYLSAVAEVVRRRAFSQSFLVWASELACHLLTIHNEEVTRRKEFQAQFDGHFLNSLFTGLEDMPPSFATEAPSIFDSRLPKILQEDVELLKKALPELAEHLNIPDTMAITNFFMIKSIVIKNDLDKVDDSKPVEEKLVQVINEVGLTSNLDNNILRATESEPCLTTAHGLPHLKDLDRGCESETDTEEFEKVGQSPLDLNFDKELPSPRPGLQDAATLTEVGDKSPIPPKKPPRTFQKHYAHSHEDFTTTTSTINNSLQRTLSVSSTQSNTESFTNIKNPSLESIDELSSLKNFSSTTESCFNSHYQQQMSSYTSNLLLRSKSISPHTTPQSPKDNIQVHSPYSPLPSGHQPINNEFSNDEFYIDESLPSSLSIETTGQTHGDDDKQRLDTANDVVALLQDNLQISRSEHDKLKSVLLKLAHLANQAITSLKLEISELKVHFQNETIHLLEQYSKVSNSFDALVAEKEKEIIENLTLKHLREIEDYKVKLEYKNMQYENLNTEKVQLEEQLNECSIKCNIYLEDAKLSAHKEEEQLLELRSYIEDLQQEKHKTIKENTDRLNREHKAEIENIRSRFKLITMESSPSETSLDKFDKNEFGSIPNHESILNQMTENFEIEKEKAVKEAIELEGEKWRKILDEKLHDLEIKFEEEKNSLVQDVAKQISEEKDKQIDVLREREKNLSLECIKYRGTIQQLADSGVDSVNSELMERINILEKEKSQIEGDLEKIKREKMDMAASVAIVEGKADLVSTPVKSMKKEASKTSSQTMVKKGGLLNIEQCKKGDIVFTFWDKEHENYRILQNSQSLFFLHSESLEALGLQVTSGVPNKFHENGEVISKEYCHARKSENRYRVPKGMKFFRVRLKPVPVQQPPTEIMRSYHHTSAALHQSHMSQSQTAAPTTCSEFYAAGSQPCLSLPSSPTKTRNLSETTDDEGTKLEPHQEEDRQELDVADGIVTSQSAQVVEEECTDNR